MTVGDASVVSWSKDSIYVSWKFDGDNRAPSNRAELRGYKIRYQAVGSSVVQYTGLLDRTVSRYEITRLHENTDYEICVLGLVTTSSSPRPPVPAQLPLGTAASAAVAMPRRTCRLFFRHPCLSDPPATYLSLIACCVGWVATV